MSDNPQGRPTKYKKEYDTEIIEFVRKFDQPLCTVCAMAENFDVGINALYDWAIEHPSFKEAFTRAKDMAHDKFTMWGVNNLLTDKSENFAQQVFLTIHGGSAYHANARRKKYKNLISDGSTSDKVQRITEEVCNGEIDTEEAERLVGIVKDQSAINHTSDLLPLAHSIEQSILDNIKKQKGKK